MRAAKKVTRERVRKKGEGKARIKRGVESRNSRNRETDFGKREIEQESER